MREEKKYKLDQVSVRLKLCEEKPLYSTEQIDTPRRAIEVMKDMLRQLDREYVCVVNLDNANRPINFNIVSMGSINASIVSMRELLKSAILSNSTSIILMHNHPSYHMEKPKPSPEDNMTTLNVMVATDLLGLSLQDHIIVSGGTGSIYSYRTELKDRFSIDGLREIVGLKDERSADYKPLAKVEEMEEQNYNQIDNVLNNTKPRSGQGSRPSIIEKMKAKKAEHEEKNKEKAMKVPLSKTDRAV